MEDECSLVKNLNINSKPKSEAHQENTSKGDGASEYHHPYEESSSNKQPFEQQIKQVPTANVEYYDMNDGQLVLMKENVTVYIHGIVRVCALKGKIEVLGHTLRSNEACTVYSPSGSPFMTAVSKRETQSESEGPQSHLSKPDLSKLGLADEEFEEVLTKITSCDVVLTIQFISDPRIAFVMKHSLLDLLPSNKLKFKIEEICSDVYVITINKDWNDLTKNVKNPDGTFERILITGGGTYCKRACFKYLTNKFLMEFKEVLLIDLNPAQSEFTIAGTISATVATEPLLGPHYTQMRTPNYSVYVGIANPLYKPNYFLHCIKKLMELCKELPNMPVIIQTNGYMEDEGINVVASVIAITEADRVVEFFNDYCRFSEPLTIETVTNKKQLFSRNEIIKPFKLHRFQAEEADNDKEIDSKLLRIVRIMWYFTDVVTSRRYNLYDIRSNRRFTPHRIQEGQLIAVCLKTNANAIYECLGWAIINKIYSRSTFTVISPFQIEDDSNFVFMLPDYSVVTPSTFYEPLRAFGRLHIQLLGDKFKPFNFHWMAERFVDRQH